jgi:alkylated DNA repair dioxygenase AlkB
MPDGLHYSPNLILQSEAEALLGFIDAQLWDLGMRRRVQHYGWRYDYRNTRIDPKDSLGPLPEIFLKTAQKIGELTEEKVIFDQVIVNEYLPGQGISAHVDCVPCFGPVIASLSLGSPCEILFQNLSTKARHSVLLKPLSLLLLSGDARYSWSHEIAARQSDIIEGLRVTRGRRVSLTFRARA